jgi:hypothetical protein
MTIIRAQLSKANVKPDADAPIIVDGQNGWLLSFRDKGGNQISFHVFILNNSIYQLLCIVPKNASSEEQTTANLFAGSLHFLPQAK